MKTVRITKGDRSQRSLSNQADEPMTRYGRLNPEYRGAKERKMKTADLTRQGADELQQVLAVLDALRSTPAARVHLSVAVQEAAGEPGMVTDDPYFTPVGCHVSRLHLIELLAAEEKHIGTVLSKRLAAEYPPDK